MPARPLSLTMTADEILAHQRERNRVKQKAFKGRQRAAKLAQQQHQQPEVQPPASERSNSSGELGRRGVTVFSPESPSFPVTPENEDEGEDGDLGVKKLAKRIAELEEGARMLKRTRVERARVGEWVGDDLEREDHLEGVEGLSGFSSNPLAGSGSSGRALPTGRRLSSASSVSSSVSTTRQSPIALFASLLNDSPPSYLHLPTLSPRSTSFIPHTLNVDLLRRSLGLPSHASPPGKLPAYSYHSPVDLTAPSAPKDSSWKVALFELHRALSENRAHPTEGYLYNEGVRATLNEAQLLIFQLMMATSSKKEHFDSRRSMTAEQADYLKNGPIDGRLQLCPDPLFRVLINQASRSRMTDLTEMAGFTIELSSIYGDVWDAGGNSLPDSFYTSLPLARLMKTGHRSAEGRGLRGASIREIVLGLDEPSWRRTDTQFPLVTPGGTEEIEVVYLAQTWGPRRVEVVHLQEEEREEGEEGGSGDVVDEMAGGGLGGGKRLKEMCERFFSE